MCAWSSRECRAFLLEEARLTPPTSPGRATHTTHTFLTCARRGVPPPRACARRRSSSAAARAARQDQNDLQTITWGLIVNQLINSATNTESVDEALADVLSRGHTLGPFDSYS